MTSLGTLEVISDASNTKFTNAAVGDLAIYTKQNTQKVHIGAALNTPSAMEVTSSQVKLNTDVQTKGVIRLSN